MGQLRRRRRRRSSSTRKIRQSKPKKVPKPKKRRSPLTEETFKEIMMQFMSKYHPPEISEIQELEENVKKAARTPNPGISTKLSRDKLKREVLRQQNVRLSEQQQQRAAGGPMTPYGAPHPPSGNQRDILYDPGTKQYSYLRKKKKTPPPAPPPPPIRAGGATPRRRSRIPTPTLTRVLEYGEDSDDSYWQESSSPIRHDPLPPPPTAEWTSPRPPATPRDEWKKENVLKGVPPSQQDAAPQVYDAVDKLVNNQGLLASTGRPKAIFDYLMKPGGKIPPYGLDLVLYEFKNNPRKLPVHITYMKHDVSSPFIPKMEALDKMNVDFRLYHHHIRNMNDTEVTRLLAAVKKLPARPSTDQYDKMDHALAQHLKMENPRSFRSDSPKTMLRTSSTMGFIKMIEAATKS